MWEGFTAAARMVLSLGRSSRGGRYTFFVSRGYVHVVGSPRGIGKSDGGGSRQWDSYDLIEWIAQQPWCDGNVGMVGISGFGAEQLFAARQTRRT